MKPPKKQFFPKQIALLSLLIASLTITSAALHGQQTDLKKMNLHGDISYIHERIYTPEEHNNKIIPGTLTASYSNYFNRLGNKTTDIRYNPEGSVDKRYLYSYDEEGRRVLQQQYRDDSTL
ncbi:MAG: hypothetical protein RQ866_07905, partial [Bacteroidales bacterium]|nr:hypothetical protein [Bacteroidales bacterium]